MPITLSGTLPVLLAQASALCAAAPTRPASTPEEAAIVQRDEAFVIVPVATMTSVAEPVSVSVALTETRLGSTVSIDPTLLASERQRISGAAR